MSKTQLKKELFRLDRDHLTQLILDAYSARKEIKAYLDFFVNPDVQALYDKYALAIHKEMIRGKYGRSTARMSRIRTYIREFASFGVDPETVIDLMCYALSTALLVKKIKFTRSPFEKGMISIGKDILKLGEKESIFSTALKKLNEALDGSEGSKYSVNSLRTELGLTPL